MRPGSVVSSVSVKLSSPSSSALDSSPLCSSFVSVNPFCAPPPPPVPAVPDAVSE